ncbi:Histone-lysine N-methyltransferase, H3 lysine-79 specific [Smittium mucronatum]|uniref:Histone-lysine N-methyltransferase, H3 lysine-79 specific n=1 Tax=Smittium mucronatum TaxID=133383 RepID=A0A1R0GUD1_9FUNG|nr:Histone-lysine N-methyltransferase, H3 lysine-79 specific [Smittium mucronatum]
MNSSTVKFKVIERVVLKKNKNNPSGTRTKTLSERIIDSPVNTKTNNPNSPASSRTASPTSYPEYKSKRSHSSNEPEIVRKRSKEHSHIYNPINSSDKSSRKRSYHNPKHFSSPSYSKDYVSPQSNYHSRPSSHNSNNSIPSPQKTSKKKFIKSFSSDEEALVSNPKNQNNFTSNSPKAHGSSTNDSHKPVKNPNIDPNKSNNNPTTNSFQSQNNPNTHSLKKIITEPQSTVPSSNFKKGVPPSPIKGSFAGKYPPSYSKLLSEDKKSKITSPRRSSTSPNNSPNSTKDSDKANSLDHLAEPQEFVQFIPPISSAAAVLNSSTRYVNYFDFNEPVHKDASEYWFKEMSAVKLSYIAPDSYERFSLLVPEECISDPLFTDEYNPISDLISTVSAIGLIIENNSSLKNRIFDPSQGILRQLEKYKNKKEGPDFLLTVASFNKLLKSYSNSSPFKSFENLEIPYEISNHILGQIYNRCVSEHVDKLRNYRAFSNNVYGEVNPILVSEFIKKCKITHNDVFVDLGCGIGNVVIQMAIQAGCPSYGVEIMDIPAYLAQSQVVEYNQRMR